MSRGLSRRVSLAEGVIEALGREIGGGVLAAGESLPVEARLAARFGVSRVVVRDAVKGLVAKGMLSVRPRLGTRVRELAAWNLLDPRVMGWRMGGLGAADGPARRRLVADLMELRRIVEPPAVRLAAERAGPAEIAAIRAAYVAMAVAAEAGGADVPADLAFHAGVLAACGNPFLARLGEALAEILRASFAISSRDARDRALSLALHEAVLLGIERRDAGAAEAAMLRLIGLGGEMLERMAGRIGDPAGG